MGTSGSSPQLGQVASPPWQGRAEGAGDWAQACSVTIRVVTQACRNKYAFEKINILFENEIVLFTFLT